MRKSTFDEAMETLAPYADLPLEMKEDIARLVQDYVIPYTEGDYRHPHKGGDGRPEQPVTRPIFDTASISTKRKAVHTFQTAAAELIRAWSSVDPSTQSMIIGLAQDEHLRQNAPTPQVRFNREWIETLSEMQGAAAKWAQSQPKTKPTNSKETALLRMLADIARRYDKRLSAIASDHEHYSWDVAIIAYATGKEKQAARKVIQRFKKTLGDNTPPD